MEDSAVFTNKSKQYFDGIAKDYNNSHDGKYVAPSYKELVDRICKASPKSILDLGCGNGNVLEQITGKVNAKLFGIDLSDNMIEEAKLKVPHADLVVGNADSLPFKDNQFDMVLCNASFHHYTNPDAVIEEVKRVLRKDGVFLLGDPTVPLVLYRRVMNYFLKYTNSGDYKIYGKKEIISLLNSKGFTVKDWKMIGLKEFVLEAVLR